MATIAIEWGGRGGGGSGFSGATATRRARDGAAAMVHVLTSGEPTGAAVTRTHMGGDLVVTVTRGAA